MLVFVRMISSEPQNILLPNLVWVCSIMNQECHAEQLVHCLQGQGHSEGVPNQNMTVSAIASKLLVCLKPNLV